MSADDRDPAAARRELVLRPLRDSPEPFVRPGVCRAQIAPGAAA